MAVLDVPVFSATRPGTTVTPHVLNVAHIGRGDDSADSGLDAFPANDGIQIRNQSSRLGIYVMNNRDEGELHISIKTSAQVDGLEVEDRIISVGAESSVLIGPFTNAYQVTNYEDSDNQEPEHTDYIQLRFAVDTLSGTETLEAGDVMLVAITVPA